MDAFTLLDHVVSKYRSDVHTLHTGATPDAIIELEQHLGCALPPGLRTFLSRTNGADLFRSTFRIRSSSEMSPASETHPKVVLFADGPEGISWAWAHDPTTGSVFGHWDGDTLEALHGSFAGWFAGNIAVIETRVRNQSDRDALRFEADPDDAYQLIRAGLRALETGNPEHAEAILRRVTTVAPNHVRGWQYLGDALAGNDRNAARQAWLQAFRKTTLPLPWPGAASLDPDVLRGLSQSFTSPEAWEQELLRFLDDRVADVTSATEIAIVVGASRELGRSMSRRGRRRQARDTLSTLLGRFNLFSAATIPWSLLLDLTRLEIDLGHHDEAETLIGRILRHGPRDLRGTAQLLLATIATTRQEPWAEEILVEAQRSQLSEPDSLIASCLAVERALRQDRISAAEKRLEKAQLLARRMAMPALTARVRLVEGDVHRTQQRFQEAHDSYVNGLEAVGERDPEVKGRLHLRLGDLAATLRDVQVAVTHYRQAIETFGEQELPIREAWSLLRVARLEVERGADASTLLQAAHTRFVEADLAGGIAATDALYGDPGRSLDWHLERATRHAQARYDAQRVRPPRTRADADRPERRLGAHRLAISACSSQVVSSLAEVVEACARAISVGRGRPLDPDVLRYIAAVDLVSAHRSYDAAQLLLTHLLQSKVDGHAYLALQGAIARSPNAALIDGLLNCVELPSQHPNTAVAAAAELLGLRREQAATRALVGLLSTDHSPAIRKAAVNALGRIGVREALDQIAACLDEPTLAEPCAVALLMLGDRRGLDFHGRALIERRSDLSGHPGELVGRFGGPEHLLLLIGAADGEDKRALGALQGLGLLGDPRAIPTLLNALAARTPQVVQVASGALSLITGHVEDVESPGYRSRWHQWWESHADGFHDGHRYRGGDLWSPKMLIRRLEADDAWERRTAYDELVITTGARIAFDADGPWRIQRGHLAGWRAWWSTHASGFKPGSWYLAGQAL